MFKNIGIFVKKNSQAFQDEAVNNMVISLSNCDVSIFIDESSSYKHKLVSAVKHEQFIKEVDIIIVFGGDGTLLNSARQYLEYEIPILGVNMGNVGFLTDIKVDSFDKTITQLFFFLGWVENLVQKVTKKLKSYEKFKKEDLG